MVVPVRVSVSICKSDDEILVGLSHQNDRFPQNRSCRTDFGKKNPAKSGSPDHFCCQNRSGRTNFGGQNWSPLPISVPQGGRFWQEVICQNRSPSLLFPILHYRAIPLGTCIGSYSYIARLACRTGIFARNHACMHEVELV